MIPAGTDYVFLSRKPFGFRNGEISFKGKAGVIQLCGKKMLLTLNQAGEISYRNNRLILTNRQHESSRLETSERRRCLLNVDIEFSIVISQVHRNRPRA